MSQIHFCMILASIIECPLFITFAVKFNVWPSLRREFLVIVSCSFVIRKIGVEFHPFRWPLNNSFRYLFLLSPIHQNLIPFFPESRPGMTTNSDNQVDISVEMSRNLQALNEFVGSSGVSDVGNPSADNVQIPFGQLGISAQEVSIFLKYSSYR